MAKESNQAALLFPFIVMVTCLIKHVTLLFIVNQKVAGRNIVKITPTNASILVIEDGSGEVLHMTRPMGPRER